MTEAKVSPARQEVEQIATLLADIDADSKHALRHFLNGSTDWRLAQRIIKRCIHRLVNDSSRRLRRDHRVQLLEYAAAYGLRVGHTLANEPMTETVRFMVTAEQKDELEQAAKQAGNDLSTWLRDATLQKARGMTA